MLPNIFMKPASTILIPNPGKDTANKQNYRQSYLMIIDEKFSIKIFTNQIQFHRPFIMTE